MSEQKKPDTLKIQTVEMKSKGKIKVSWTEGSIESSITRDLPQHKEFTKAISETLSFLGQYNESTEEVMSGVSLKKVTIAHYEDKKGMSVQISGVRTHQKSGQNTTLTTSKMATHEDHYGFEASLKKAINKFCEEAYQYAVQMKSAQLKIAS